MLKRVGDGNALYLMHNTVTEDSVYNPIEGKFEELRIFILPRSYMVGLYINTWLVVDSIENSGSLWFIKFRTITSTDNWLPSHDKTCLVGEVTLTKVGDTEMRIRSKKLDRR
jgi:hypothetical protein